jgi:hypothetical protein
LSAQLQVFLFVFGAYGFSGFLAEFAGFEAAFFFAKFRYVSADFLHIFRFQHGSVCANQEAEFSRHDARFNVLDALKNFVAELFSAYFHFWSLLQLRGTEAKYEMLHLKKVLLSFPKPR